MLSNNIIINNSTGLLARPATFFIQKANEFKCSIWIQKDDKKVNAKSLLGVLSLSISAGQEINIIADGEDEEAAIKELTDMIKKDFKK